MYFDDHGTPHFHILSNDGNVSVAIDTMKVLAGSLPPSVLKEAKAWASENKALLHTKWKEFSL